MWIVGVGTYLCCGNPLRSGLKGLVRRAFGVTSLLLYLSLQIPLAHAACADTEQTVPCVEVPHDPNDERILATLQFPGRWMLQYGVSADGRYVYAVTSGVRQTGAGDRDGNTRLIAYDVSNPEYPRQTSSLDLHDAGLDQFVVRGNVAFVIRRDDRVLNRNSHFVVIDLGDPSQPKLAVRYDSPPDSPFAWAQVSADGNTVALHPQFGPVSGATTYVDVADRQRPEVRTDLPAEITFFASRTAAGLSDPLSAPAVQPIGQAGVFIAGSYTQADVIDIFTTRAPPFDVDRLRATYKAMLKEQDDCLSGKLEPFCLRHPDPSQLEFAGVRQLLSALPSGMAQAERVLILNDYGFWLAAAVTPRTQESVSVLEQVVLLDPQRSVAWLNLGDAARQALLGANDDDIKALYWSKANAAYQRYKVLTGKLPADRLTLTRFDLPAVRSSASDVCDYVAEAFSTDNGDAISATEGDFLRNGNKVSFAVRYNMGSCATKSIKVKGEEDQEPPELQMDGSDGGTAFDDVRVIPFRGTAYALSVIDGGPYEVVSPYHGHVCSFRRTFKPHLAENASPALCQAFLGGSEITKLPWSTEHASAIPRALVDDPGIVPNEAGFDGTAVVDLAGDGQPLQVGHFDLVWTGGCTCSEGGVALLTGNSMDNSQSNKGLLDLQHIYRTTWGKGWAMCAGSDSELVRIDGREYVQQHSGRFALEGHPASRALLELKNGAFQRVCRVEQIPIYVADRKPR